MTIQSGLEQTIERVRQGNERQIHGVSQHAGSDIERLLKAADEAADLRRQLDAHASTDPTVPMLQRIKAAVDSILAELAPNEFDEPINWGDLYAASVSFRIDDDGRTSTLVEIEEAAPGCEKLCKVVSDRLALMGWQAVTVTTEW